MSENLLNLDYLKSQAQSYGTEPYWFGLGFIQLKLNDRERMHFWLPEIPSPEREEIHNHRYDFHSTVLAGKLRHEVYSLILTQPSIPTDWEIFKTDCTSGKEGTVETVVPCLVKYVGVFDLQAGSTYDFPHTSYHTTEGTEFAITHLTRQPKVLEYASVIKKQGVPTTCPFKDKIPAEQCWEYIAAALIRA